MRVHVVGAGVVGLAVATELAERGAEVELWERSTQLGAQACSWCAGGMLAPWCERATAPPLITSLGQEGIAWWRRHHAGTQQHGTLVVASGAHLGLLRQLQRRTHNHRWLNAKGVAALEPHLATRFAYGLFFPEEAHMDPRQALPALAWALAQRGTVLHYGVKDGPPTAAQGAVVDCRGVSARDTLPTLRGVQGEMALLHSSDVAFTRPIRLLHPQRPVYLVPRQAGVMMIGATQIENDARHVSVRSALDLLSAAAALHPELAQAHVVELRAEVRPALAHNLPRILRCNGRVYVNGMYRHGMLLAPALARRAARVVLEASHFPEVMEDCA